MCCMAPLDKFNFVMVVFALISIASFDDTVIQKVTNSIQGSDEWVPFFHLLIYKYKNSLKDVGIDIVE